MQERYSANRIQLRVVRERTGIHRLPGPTSSDSGTELSLVVGLSRSFFGSVGTDRERTHRRSLLFYQSFPRQSLDDVLYPCVIAF